MLPPLIADGIRCGATVTAGMLHTRSVSHGTPLQEGIALPATADKPVDKPVPAQFLHAVRLLDMYMYF